MGYKRQRKTLRLRFEDEPELEVLAKSVSVRKFLGVARWADDMRAGKVDQAGMEEICTWLAEQIVSWNLEDDDGQPVPVSADYLLDEDFDWTIKVFMGWFGAIVGALKLPATEFPGEAQASPDPEEASIPMQPVTPDSASGTS